MSSGLPGPALELLAARLRERREELAQAVATRVWAVADPGRRDPEYIEGLRASLYAALDYCILAVESAGDAPALPDVLLRQARLAVRNRVSLDVVLRRYFAGYTVFADFLIRDAEAGQLLESSELQRVIRTSSSLFDQLIASVTDEYERESGRYVGSTDERRAERVRRLLAGEMTESADLGYDFDGWHLAAVVVGARGDAGLRTLAAKLDRRLLVVEGGDGTYWGWLGGRLPFDIDQVFRCLVEAWPRSHEIALGQPGSGLAGWRLTHRQARAALPVVQRTGSRMAPYRDVALVASMVQDDLLVTSLRQLYLEPLERERDGGVLMDTLRAYFAGERNLSAAAAALGVSRRTVANRLRRVEAVLGRPLTGSTLDFEAALRLARLQT